MARVLLVDEDPHIREATAFRLQVDGHQVIAVPDAEAAVAAAADSTRGGPPLDVALLDVEAPGVDDTALSALRASQQATSALPVVFYSGNPASPVLPGRPAGDGVPARSPSLARLLATIASLAPRPVEER